MEEKAVIMSNRLQTRACTPEFIDETAALENYEKRRISLAKLLIRLDKTNKQLDRYISKSELDGLRQKITTINTELLKISIFLSDKSDLSPEEREELKAAGERNTELLMDLLVGSLNGSGNRLSEAELREREENLKKKKEQLHHRLNRIEKTLQNGDELTADDIARLSEERHALLKKVEATLDDPDFFLGMAHRFARYAAEDRHEKVGKTIDKLARLTKDALPIRAMRVLSSLLFTENVEISEIEAVTKNTGNPIFLQYILSLRPVVEVSYGQGKYDNFKNLIKLILSKTETFSTGLLADAYKFFKDDFFISNPEYHGCIMQNTAAPSFLAGTMFPISEEVLAQAEQQAERNFFSRSLLDTLSEVVRIEPKESTVIKILNLVIDDPIRKYRFFKIAAWRGNLSPELRKFLMDRSVLDASDLQ